MLSLLLVAVLIVPATAASKKKAARKTCRQACGAMIDACRTTADAFGFGDVGKGCRRAALKACKRTGTTACGDFCGDGVARPGEACDGADLRDATCESLGFASGALACSLDCGFDTGGCVPNPAAQTCPTTTTTTTLPPDGDGDGVGDSADNCPTVPNADQDPAACDCPCFTHTDIDSALAGANGALPQACHADGELNWYHLCGGVSPATPTFFRACHGASGDGKCIECGVAVGCNVIPISTTEAQTVACRNLILNSAAWSASGCPIEPSGGG